MSLCSHVRRWVLAIMALPLLVGAEEVAILDASSGSVSAPFVITNGCVCQLISREANKGRAVYDFTVTNSGSYVLRGFVNASAGDANSLLVNIDSEPDDPAMAWDIPVTAGFTNSLISWRGESEPASIRIARKVFKLSEGKHRLILRGNAGNVQLARIAVLRLPAPPTGLHMTGGPGS